jgi:hypothetical protein
VPRVDFEGASDFRRGLILVREVDKHLDLGELIKRQLSNLSEGKNSQSVLVTVAPIGVQPIGRVAGYQDVNNAGRHSRDPTFSPSRLRGRSESMGQR